MKQEIAVTAKHRGRRFRFRPVVLALVPFAIIVIGFELLPLIYMLMTSLLSDDETHYTLSQYATALTSPYYRKAIQNSLLISLKRKRNRHPCSLVYRLFPDEAARAARDRLLSLSTMTSNFAGVPLAFAYIILLGNNGVFTLLLKSWGLDVFTD